MSRLRETHHDTARLYFMDRGGLEPRDLAAFHAFVRAEHPDLTLTDVMHLWQDYAGMDGRTRPRLDFLTGRVAS